MEYSTRKSIFEFENIVVCELDDYDPSLGFASSLTDVNYEMWRIDQQGNVHGGFEQNDANAIDLSFANMNDNSKILLSLPSREKVFDFNYFESFYEKGFMDSNMQFSTPVSVIIIEDDGDIVRAPLIWRIGHMRYSQEDTPLINSLLNNSVDQITEDTIVGYIERIGQGHVIMNLAVYADYCKNKTRCIWQNPGEDPNALILPFALFVNHDQEMDILEAFLRSNPETK